MLTSALLGLVWCWGMQIKVAGCKGRRLYGLQQRGISNPRPGGWLVLCLLLALPTTGICGCTASPAIWPSVCPGLHHVLRTQQGSAPTHDSARRKGLGNCGEDHQQQGVPAGGGVRVESGVWKCGGAAGVAGECREVQGSAGDAVAHESHGSRSARPPAWRTG